MGQSHHVAVGLSNRDIAGDRFGYRIYLSEDKIGTWEKIAEFWLVGHMAMWWGEPHIRIFRLELEEGLPIYRLGVATCYASIGAFVTYVNNEQNHLTSYHILILAIWLMQRYGYELKCGASSLVLKKICWPMGRRHVTMAVQIRPNFRKSLKIVRTRKNSPKNTANSWRPLFSISQKKNRILLI